MHILYSFIHFSGESETVELQKRTCYNNPKIPEPPAPASGIFSQTEEKYMFYYLLEIIIVIYGILLAVKPDLWWKVTNKNTNQKPPHSYLGNTRIMGIVFAVIGVILLLLSLL